MPIPARFSCADELTYATVASHAEHNIPITLLCQWNRLNVEILVEKISRMHESQERKRWFYIYTRDARGAKLILKVEPKSGTFSEQKISQVRTKP